MALTYTYSIVSMHGPIINSMLNVGFVKSAAANKPYIKKPHTVFGMRFHRDVSPET